MDITPQVANAHQSVLAVRNGQTITSGPVRLRTGPFEWGPCGELELTFLDDPLVRFVGALDAILAVVAFGRQQLCDFVDRARAAAAIGAGRVEHILANPELVIAQVVLHAAESAQPAAAAGPNTLLFRIHA